MSILAPYGAMRSKLVFMTKEGESGRSAGNNIERGGVA